MKDFSKKHPALYRAIRTFFQSAVGVIAAAITAASGVVDKVEWQAVIVLAVSTGLAAVMNLNGGGTDVERDD
jgi:xanthine/uracil/vitamin C permease (AzgA family)